jgi:hypothetical protein
VWRTVGDSFVTVALAEIPESDLVKIVKAEGPRQRVDEHEVVGGANGEDVGQVEVEEVGVADDGTFVKVADQDLNIISLIHCYWSGNLGKTYEN